LLGYGIGIEPVNRWTSERAVVGFSLGAYYAFDLAADPEHIRSVVIFYGTGPADHGKSKAAQANVSTPSRTS
jgi:dienelactone hydrolase